MSKKRRKPKSKSSVNKKNAGSASYQQRKTKRGIRRAIVSALVVAGLIGAGIFGIDRYQALMADERDLTDIGNGTPTVVQVHDPDCPLCRQLMKNTKSALRGYGDKIQFRIADLSTGAGRDFQRTHHNVANVTLVFFNGSGQFQWVLSGVSTVEKIDQELSRLLRRS